MIIRIQGELCLAVDQADKIIALENIIKSHGEGKHHVWIPAPTIKELCQVDGFGHFTRRTLDAMVSQASEGAYLHKEFDFYAVVNFVDKHALSHVNGVLDIGYAHFLNTTTTQESILLAENELDGEAYYWGAKTYLQLKRVRGAKVNLEIAHGGGNTTYNYFIRLDNGRRFFASIVDSDREHPKGSLGATAARFRHTKVGYDRKRYFEILSCHEIENIIPLRVLTSINEAKLKESLVYRPDNIDFRVYPDHKTGLSLKDAKKSDKLHKDEYWKKFDDLDPDTLLCSNFGENLLKDCVEYVRRLSPKESREHIDEEVDKEWLRICKVIASWGVSSRGLLS